MARSRPALCNTRDYTVHGILQARRLGWVAVLFSRGLPNPGIEPRSPTLQADSLPAESPGQPRNTGVGSLSLLQGIFLTQEWNRGLPHCRRILYRLSHQGSPVTLNQRYILGKLLSFKVVYGVFLPDSTSILYIFFVVFRSFINPLNP